MKILVTGASGFLGQTLCPQLRNAGHEVLGLTSRDADLRDPHSLDVCADRRFDQVFHLAAWTQAGDFCLRHPGEQWIINQQINTHVLAWWQRHQPQAKLVCIGTSCAYDPELPLTEDNYLRGVPIESLFTYAMTKRMLYAGLLALRKQYGLNFLYAVPSTLYGPGYHTDGRQMHFIFDLMRKILRGRAYREPVVLWGDGHQRRELMHVQDFVHALLALNERCANEIVNLGAGEEYSIRHFAGLIAQRIGFPADQIAYDPSRYVGARSKCLEVRKLKLLLPDLSLTPLPTGLAQTLEWFQSQAPALLGPAPA